MTRFADLPASVQRQLRAGDVVPAKRTKSRRVASGQSTWRCHRCGAQTSVWAQAERHAHAEGHVRIELVVAEETLSTGPDQGEG